MPKAQYKALADAIAALINNGHFAPGERLPTYRQYAETQGVALATATRVYKELISRGLVVGEKGRGVFVRDPGIPLSLGVEQNVPHGMLDLVFNMPSEESDEEFLRNGLKKLASSGDLAAMLRYQPHGGRPHERQIIANHLDSQLGKVDAEKLLIVSGAQHGLSAIVLGLFSSNESVVTDALTYTGFRAIAALHKLTLLPGSNPETDVHPDTLDCLCTDQKVKAVYLMPTVQNPLGNVMSEPEREKITAVARKHNIMIIEDGAYAFLETNPPPSFLELAPERTIHVSGFSKSLATGLRLGYIIAPDIYIPQLTLAIRATTWNTPGIVTGMVMQWIKDGTLSLSEERRRLTGIRQQLMCKDIITTVPIVSHNAASFAWLPLPKGSRTSPIVSRLISKGVVVSDGAAFSVTDTIPQGLRIAFGGTSDSDLQAALIKINQELLTLDSAEL